MSRGRRHMIQLDEPASRTFYSNEPTYNQEMEQNDEEDDDAGDMPTPERLVTEDMLPDSYNETRPTFSMNKPAGELDNKVANFLAEIDAMDEPMPEPPPPAPVSQQDVHRSPVRDSRSPVRSKPNAYSNMFVKGTPEFVQTKKGDSEKHGKQMKLEPWPEEPTTDWQQLKDEKTNYPYYWNMHTNAVVWDMPPEFSQYLLRHKEYEEKVERGLREGTLDPKQRPGQQNGDEASKESKQASAVKAESAPQKTEKTEHKSKHRKNGSSSEDSSSDSSDSEGETSRKHKPRSPRQDEKSPKRETEKGGAPEVSSSSSSASSRDSHKHAKSSVSPDSTRPDDKKPVVEASKDADDSMDFDIDDIDKQLEMALEKKRQELMKKEENKEKVKEEKPSKGEDDRHRKHSRHDRDRDSRHERDRRRDRDDREEKKPKLTLKERLRIEMELKMEKERRKKKAIEDLMARELEQTVVSTSRGHKRHSEDRDSRDSRDKSRGHKRYRHEEDRYGDRYRDRDDYDNWDHRGGYSSNRNDDDPRFKPPPPTEEMMAYKEDRKSQVVDYGHGRSRNGDSDEERSRSADAQDNEVKKLEVLQLAELALSKLEFLEVSKKGLSKLQILLIELETRHQDWQAGGLTTIHFLAKLREANWQLEQYEGSAAPLGWKCSWDRDYRRYYYTHKRTGKTQWDYPDADEMKNEDDKAEKLKKEMTSSSSKTEPSSSSQYSFQSPAPPHKLLSAVTAPPPPPPPPAEEHSAVKSLQLMYGSDSEEEETEEQQQPPKEPPAPILPDELPPLPPDNHHHKEKKEKKKKKKKDKSKKKEKTESAIVAGPSGQEFMSVGSMYPITMPALPPSQPPPPGVEPPTPEPTNVVDSSSAIAQVPVYGGSDADHYAMNDLPLKFGSVIESGPQLASDTVSYQQPPPPTDGEPAIGHYTSEAGGIGEPDQGVPDGAPFGHEAPQGVAPATEEKKKKKKEKMGSGSISLKKKHVSSMVQKWQKVKKEVELEEQTRQMREAEIRRKLAELE
ncbi:formin-binding protein 4-like [Mya arenaria]|uniref:formin-binding protein 4-like n=1 Tax=Mya arenaria TaxID=6604 RepID=UPI0022E80634|nr:formin-binding protein 4-like [Mya arenaria]